MSGISTDSHIREVIEMQIKVPYGHLAAKWWGRRDVRPVLCIHGWQDNAATFDTLIPLLPDHVGYLAIDMPGHGLSSRIPDGLVYTAIDDLYILNFIIRQFGWDRVSLMGHSMGAITCFLYAASFADRVDFVVALDALQPRVISEEFVSLTLSGLESVRLNELRNTDGVEPPTHTIDEMIEKMNSQTFLSVSRSSAMYLLARSTKESSNEKGRFYFTRDHRLKHKEFPLSTHEINEAFAKSITCPFLFVKALQSPFYDLKANMDDVLEILMQKDNFAMTTVDGGHHVHLNKPEVLCEAITSFLLKHQQQTVDHMVYGSKL